MLEQTIAEIEERIRTLTGMDDSRKEDLAELLSKLKAEVSDLSQTQAEQAETITRFIGLSAHELTRGEPNEVLQKISLDGLAESVKGFEASHPGLAKVVNRICLQLSDLGI